MKSLFKICIVAICCFILSSAQCEKEEADSLPPETQEGKKTFGCLINGELFANINKQVYFGVSPLTAYYSRSMNTFSITAQKQKTGNLDFGIVNPKENQHRPIDIAAYLSQNKELCTYFAGKDVGEIILTRFDTINLVVSGRFHFTIQCSDPLFNPIGNSIIKVTEGRFDLRLEMVDN